MPGEGRPVTLCDRARGIGGEDATCGGKGEKGDGCSCFFRGENGKKGKKKLKK